MTAFGPRLAARVASVPPGIARGASPSASRLPPLVAFYLLTVVVPIGFLAGSLAMTTLRLLLLATIVPLTIQLLAGRFGRVMATDLLFGAHVLWTIVALAVNTPAQVVQQTGSVGVEFLGGYVLGRACIRTPQAFEALARALVVLVCCTLPFALFEAVTGQRILLGALNALPGFGGPPVVDTEMRMGLHRVQSAFAHPIHYGLFCSIALPLAFVALKGLTGQVRRVLTSMVVAACVFLSLSSGALLAMMLQAGLIAWSAMLARVRSRWWLLVGLFALAYVVVDILSNRPPMRVFMSYATFSPHNAYWRATIVEWGMKSVWSHPVFGIGLSDWVRPEWMHSGSIDNFWLLTAMRYGIPGFLLLAVGYGIGVVQVMRRKLDGDAVLSRIRRSWVFIFLGLSFTLYTVHVWTNVYSFVFFMFGAGMWLVDATPNAGGPRPEPCPPTRPASAYTRFPPIRRNGPRDQGAETTRP